MLLRSDISSKNLEFLTISSQIRIVYWVVAKKKKILKYKFKIANFNRMLNLILKCYNQKCEKSCNGKVLQDFENAGKNILRIIQRKSYNRDKLIKQ